MTPHLQVDIVTIFPKMLAGFLQESILKRATQKGLVSFRIINLRNFTTDRHKTTDDKPYGGGPGMVMKPEPMFKAVESVRTSNTRVILMCPQGKQFTQSMAADLSKEEHLVFLCGHYEGVDERVRLYLATDEISIGDYILTNGTLAAAVVVDAITRLVPGVLGTEEATATESFANGMLEYPQYTRPYDFRGMKVPDVLLSGNHAEISKWREEQSVKRTMTKRADLLRQ